MCNHPMALRFLPGDPNKGYNTIDCQEWGDVKLLSYCSGNNLIIIENAAQLLQTIYLPSDGRAVAIDPTSGCIAVAYDCVVHVYQPIKSFNDPIRWELHFEVLENDFVDAVSWGAGDLLIGSDRLSLWRNSTKQMIWHERMPQRIRFCTFSPDGRLICTFGLADCLPKIWERNSFDSENISLDFDYIMHPTEVVWASWRTTTSPELNVLYTFATDGVLRVWSRTQAGPFGLWGSMFCGHVSPAVINNTRLPPQLLGSDADELTDFVLVWDESTVSAYSIKNVGGLRRDKLAKITCMVDRAPLNVARLQHMQVTSSEAQLMVVEVDKEVKVLVHEFSGGLYFLGMDTEKLLSPDFTTPRVATILSTFTGHQKSIQAISRSKRGDRLFSQSRFSENWVWEALPLRQGTTLITKSKVNVSEGQILWSVVRDKTLVTLTAKELKLWDIQRPDAQPLASVAVEDAESCKNLFELPSSEYEGCFVAVFGDCIRSWIYRNGHFEDCGASELPDLQGKVFKAASVDPVQTKVDSSEQDRIENGLITVTETNWTQCWCLVLADNKVTCNETARFHLDGEDPVVRMQMSSNKRLAIAQRQRLRVFDSRHHIIDMDERIGDGEAIKDLDWTTTSTEANLLGVGFSHKVVIYCQQRYDYSKELDAWMPIRVIDISPYTPHEIGDSVWLKDGTFVIGAGNQLFIQDCHVDMKDEKMRRILQVRNTISAVESASTIYDIAAVLNGPLALYHPQFLIQAIYVDRLDVVARVLVQLLHHLKFGEVDSLLGLDPLDLLEHKTDAIAGFTPKVAEDIEALLQKVSLPYLTRHQQVTLLGVIQSLDMILNNLHGIDVFGIKFLLGHRLFLTHKASQSTMTMRDFVWASLSSSKAVLLHETLKLDSLNWELMRNVGIPYWVDRSVLVDLTENLARQVYASTRDPVLTSLYHLALRKKSVLQGLWRVAAGHPEQQKTIKLLNHDYAEARWKTAALKNAYALLSKRRYEYAAALFLLGDSLNDACNVLVRNVKDVALAVLVARVYDGDDGPGMQNLVDRHLLTISQETNDRWMASWANQEVGRKTKAVQSIMFVDLVAESTKVVRQMEDPVLTVLYKTLRTNVAISTRSELDFLQKAAFIYTRMGCELIALDMARNWQFVDEALESSRVAEVEEIVATETPEVEKEADVVASAKPEPPPQAMAEPDMSAFEFGF